MGLGDDIGSLYRSIENFSVLHGATPQDLINSAQTLMEIDKRVEVLKGQSILGTDDSRQCELMRQQCSNAKNKLIAEVYHARSTASSMDKQLMDAVLSKLVAGAPRQGGQKRKAEENNDEVGVGKQKHGPSRPLVVHQDVRNLVMSIEAALQDPTIDLPRCESMLREIEICRQSMEEHQGDTISLDQLQAVHNAVISVRDEQLSNQVGRLVGRIFESDEEAEDDMNLREASAERARREEQVQSVNDVREVIEVVQQARDTMVAECEMIVDYLHTGAQQLTEVLNEAIDSMEISVEKDVVQAQVDKKLADKVSKVNDVLEEVQKRGEVNFRLTDGWTPLMFAAVHGSAEQVQKLLDKGADANYPSEQGQTPLLVAVEYGRIDTVRILLGRGAGGRGVAIGRAIVAGRVDIVRLLIEKGVDPNFIWKGLTLLALAVRCGKIEIVRYLLSVGADVNFCTSDKHSALMEAASSGNVNVLQALLEAGANVDARDKDGWTALMFAVGKGRKDVVEVLVGTGACDINSRDKNGNTALMRAIVPGNFETVALLMRCGADPNIVTSLGMSALVAAKLLLPRDEYRKIKDLLSVYSPVVLQHKKIYSGTKVLVNAASKPVKWCTYKDLRGEERSIEAQGLLSSNYFSRVMGKNWKKYTEAHPEFLPAGTVKRVQNVLELNEKSFHIPVEEMVEIYLEGSPIIISSGFSEHYVSVVLSGGFVLLANRGAGTRKTSLEVFRFIDGKDKDPKFLKNYISRLHQLNSSGWEEYRKFVEKEFNEPYYQQRGREVETVMEETLSLPLQTIENCPWANLEQSLIGIMALEAIQEKVVGEQSLSTESIKKILLGEVRAFEEFAKYQVDVALGKFRSILNEFRTRVTMKRET